MIEDVKELCKKEKETLVQDLEIVALTSEVEVEKELQESRVEALCTSAHMTKDILRLESAIAIMEVRIQAVRKKEALEAKCRELSLQLLSSEDKQKLVDMKREAAEQHINEIKARYGIK